MKKSLYMVLSTILFGGMVAALSWPNPPSGEPTDGRLGSLVYPDITNDRVGVGTGAPQSKFQIQSDKTSGTGTISSTGTAVSGSGTSFSSEFSVGDDIVANGETRIISTVTDNTNLTVNSAFSSDLTAGTDFEYSTPRLVVTAAGKLGIGTTSPTEAIEIAGNIIPTADDTYSLGSATRQWKDIYVGTASLHIGTKKLALTGGDLQISDSDGSNAELIGTQTTSGMTEIEGQTAVSGVENVVTSGSSTTVTTANDDFIDVVVGASITANSITRHVVAKTNDTTITVDSAVDWDNSGSGYSYTYKNPLLKLSDESSDRLMVRADGNIGIGTIDPTVDLDINGDLRIQNLTNCNTIDTDVNGNLSCGTDAVDDADASITNEIQDITTNRGMERDGSNNFGLISSCTDTQVLKWNNGSSIWECGDDSGGSGDIEAIGDVTTGSAFTQTAGNDGNVLYFEGATADENEIQLTAADAGSDVTVTIPAVTGSLYISGGTDVGITDGGTGASDAAGAKTNLGFMTDLIDDTTPQLAAQLDVNGFGIGNGTEELISFVETSSAVNEITIKNAATGNSPEIQATGDDTNIGMIFLPKGTGVLSVVGTTDYESNVSGDDDIPNKKWIMDQGFGGGNDLDSAYDQGGAGIGRTITVDSGAIQLTGSNASDETLEITNSAAGGTLLIENTGTGNAFRVNDEASDTSPFIIDAAGNIGIGTTSPNATLDVEGDIETSGDILPDADNTYSLGTASYRWKDVHIGPGSLYVNGKKVISDEANTMTFATNTDQSMLIKTVGTAGNLNLRSDNLIDQEGKGGIQMNIPNDNSSKHLNLSNNSLNGNITITTNGTGSEIQLDAASAIDLTAPSINLSGNAGISSSSSATDLTTVANYPLIVTNTDTTASNFVGMRFEDDNGHYAGIAAVSTDHANDYGDLAFLTKGSGGFSEHLRITDDGNIGIGTSSPNEKLTVEGVTSLVETTAPSNTSGYGKLYLKSADSKLYFQDDGGSEYDLTTVDGHSLNADDGTPLDALYVNADGKVGIGTTSPSTTLHVYDSLSDAELTLESGASDESAKIYYKQSDQSWYMGMTASGAFRLQDATEGTRPFQIDSGISVNMLSITSDNRIGIKTDTPDTTLELSGTLSFSPSNTQSITAAGGITTTKSITRVQGSGGAITVTATPNIVDGADGQIVIYQGDNDTNTLTLQDESNLTGSGLELSGGVNFTLGKGDILQLVYDAGDDKWYEISRSDN